jgi:hypothetical protein
MLAKNGACFAPVSHLAEGEKRSGDELVFLVLQLNKDWVRSESHSACCRRTAIDEEDAVFGLVGLFLF